MPKKAVSHWTAEEEALLKAFAEKCLPWKEATGLLPRRSAAACETYWAQKLKYRYAVNPRRRLSKGWKAFDTRFRDDRSADGDPIYAGAYVFRVPEGDPYLQKLIQVHGADTINRTVILPPSAQRTVVRTGL